MTNYYTAVTGERQLSATSEEYEALEAALYSAEYNGFEVYYDDENEEVWVFAEHGDLEALPNAFLVLLGTLIAKNGLEYLEFVAALADEWPPWWVDFDVGAPGCFRIRSNGSIWEPTLTW